MAFGVSNSFKRGTVKTYSRQKPRVEDGYNVDRPRKRIRMSPTGEVIEETIGGPPQNVTGESREPHDTREQERDDIATRDSSSSITAPSSPPAGDRALFSSDASKEDDSSELSSPPSSPPRLPSPASKSRKPAFSFLKRKRTAVDDGSASEPLSNITPNARKIPRTSKKAMTQMKIDLGGEVRKTCRSCGMEYIPSVKEDTSLHDKFCAINAGGVDMGKAFLSDDTVKRIRSDKASGDEREMVVTVDRRSSLAARNRTRKVLEIVNAELSSADIDDEYLWGPLNPAEKVFETRKGTREGTDKRADRFKAFMYMADSRCVGFCLAEKISSAFPVVRAQTGQLRDCEILISKTSSISVSTSADAALLGISRIWTSKSHRNRGLAVNLLDCVTRSFFYGVQAPKHLVAFSQPTESGGRLAKRWFEAEEGWHVYRGDH